jgi:regulator of protease activity HflC (stomatin/prohibitin superfamily)
VTWLSVLGEWLRGLSPLVIVRSYQRGVRFWLGAHVTELPPGWYFKLLALWDVDVVDVQEQIVELDAKSITTRDKACVCVKAAVRFRIVDAVKYHTAVQHTDHSIQNLCEVHLHKEIRRRTFDAIHRGQGALERKLLAALVAEAAAWGVAVSAFELTEFVPAKHYRLYNGGY